MTKNRLSIITAFLIFGIIHFGIIAPVWASQINVTTTGVGFIIGSDIAAARDRAIRDAQIRALEQALGVKIDARVALHKSLLIDDTIVTRTKGIVRKYTILDEGRDENGIYTVTLNAIVDTVVMTDELIRMAGQKKVLFVRSHKPESNGRGDKILMAELATAFAYAGFNLKQISIPETEFRMLDAERIMAISKTTGRDLIVGLGLDSSVPQCMASNFCVASANGFVRMYAGKTGAGLAAEKKDNVRGYGNTPDLAGNDAFKKGAGILVDGLMSSLFFPQEKDLKIVVRNLSNFKEYKMLLKTLETLRWVMEVKEDTVGYHPVKSVFCVRFAQNLSIFAKMLDKLGKYNFVGRSGNVYTLELKNGKGERKL